MAEFNAEYNDATGQIKGNIDLNGINSNAEVKVPEGLTSAQNNEKEDPQLKQLSESLDGIFKDLSDQLLEMSGLKEKEESSPELEFLSGFNNLSKDDDEDSILGFTDPNQTDKNALKDIPAVHGLGFALVLNKLDEILGFMTTTWGEKKEDGGGKSGGGLGGLFKSLGGMGGLMQAATALLVFAGALAIAETFGISEKSLFLLALFTTFVVGFAFLGKLVKKEEQTFRDMAMGSLLMSVALIVFTGAIYFAGFVAKKLIEDGLLLGSIVMIGLFSVFVLAVVLLGNLVKSQTPSFVALGTGALLLSASIIVFSLGIISAGLAAQYIVENGLIAGTIVMFAAFIGMMVLTVVAAGVVGPALVGVALIGVGALLLSAALITFSYGLVLASEKFDEVDWPQAIELFVTMGIIFVLASAVGNALIVGSVGIGMLSIASLLLSAALVAFTGAVKVSNNIKIEEVLKVAGIIVALGVITLLVSVLAIFLPVALNAAVYLAAFAVVFSIGLIALSFTFKIIQERFADLKVTEAAGIILKISGSLALISLSLVTVIPSLILAGVMSLLLIPLVSILNSGIVSLIVSMEIITGGLLTINERLTKLDELPDGVSGVSKKIGSAISTIVKEFSGIASFGLLLKAKDIENLSEMSNYIKNIFSDFSEIFSYILSLDLSNGNLDAAKEVTIMLAQVLGDIITDLATAAEGMGRNARRSMKVIGESIGPVLESLNTLVGLIDYFSDENNIIKPEQRIIIKKNISGLIDVIEKDVIEGMSKIKIGGLFSSFPSKKQFESLTSGISSMKEIADILREINVPDERMTGLTNLISNLSAVGDEHSRMINAKRSFSQIEKIFKSLEKFNLDSLTSLDATLKEIDLARGMKNISVDVKNLGPAMDDLKVAIESFNNIEDAGIVHFGKILLAISDDLTTGNISHLAMAMHSLVQSVNQVDIKSATAIGDMALKLLGNPMAAASIQATGATLITENSASEDPSMAIYRILKKWDSKGFPEGNPGLNSSSSASSSNKKAAVEEKGGFKWPPW